MKELLKIYNNNFIACEVHPLADSYRWFSHVTYTEVPPLAFKELINVTIM